MKRLLLSLAAVASMSALQAQCTDLIISEYIEGSGNNKAVELYNTTDQAIDLSEYAISRASNGSFPEEVTFQPLGAGTIQPYSTYVLVIDKRDPNGSGQEAPIDAELQAKGDKFLCPDYNTNNAMYFNGDDAVVLFKGDNVGTAEPIDMMGKIGEDPGSAWTDDASAGYTDANQGVWWTRDQTLIRKSSIKGGMTQIPTEFNPTLEWDSLPRNTFSELGKHDCECDPNFGVGIGALKSNMLVKIFPNPADQNGEVYLISDQIIADIKLVDLAGKVAVEMEVNKKRVNLNTANITPGVYMLTVSNNNSTTTERLIIK